VEPCLLLSLWGFEGSLTQAFRVASEAGFDGLEINLKHPVLAATAAAEQLQASQRPLILEVVTGGGYVPELHLTPRAHLDELRQQLEECVVLRHRRVSVITGSDAWPLDLQIRFLGEAVAIARASGLAVSFETHRSRCLGHPWSVVPILESVPDLRLTADLSHWCVVAERLMTPDLEPIVAMADRVDHIHARVGHAQGPQVSHPFAPEHAEALAAHLACWRMFAERIQARDATTLSFTPEFGPDGYLPTLPFTHQPVADLLEINTAMAHWLRARFGSEQPG
jgi:sugar phosphate isomerase/epimerase